MLMSSLICKRLLGSEAGLFRC